MLSKKIVFAIDKISISRFKFKYSIEEDTKIQGLSLLKNKMSNCQKAFVTNHARDFGLLLRILGFYCLTGSFEFKDLFEIFNNLVYNNEVFQKDSDV